MGVRVADINVPTSRKCEIFVRKVKQRTSEEALKRGRLLYTVPEGIDNLTALTILEKFVAVRNSPLESLFRRNPLLKDQRACEGSTCRVCSACSRGLLFLF